MPRCHAGRFQEAGALFRSRLFGVPRLFAVRGICVGYRGTKLCGSRFGSGLEGFMDPSGDRQPGSVFFWISTVRRVSSLAKAYRA